MSEIPKPRHWFAPGVNRVRDALLSAYEHAKALAVGHPVEIIVRPVKSRRTLAANAKMWAALADISRQVEWAVNRRGLEVAHHCRD